MKPQDVLRRVAGTAVVLGGLGLALGGCVAVPAPGYYGYAAPYSSGYYDSYYNGAYYSDYAYPGYGYYGYGPGFYGVGIYGGCCRSGHPFHGHGGGHGHGGHGSGWRPRPTRIGVERAAARRARSPARSEERRVGKESRSRWSP